MGYGLILEKYRLIEGSERSVLERYYLSEKYIFCKSDVIEEFNEMEEVENMPIYPKEGSIKIINDVLVLKR